MNKLDKVRVYTLLILALLAPTMAACSAGAPPPPLDSVVEAVHTGTALHGIKQAAQGAQGTLILMRENLVMFSWTTTYGRPFVIVDAGRRDAIEHFANVAQKGQLINTKTMNDLINSLKRYGWEPVAASQIPEVVKLGLMNSASWLTRLAQSMTTFLVLPAGVLMPEIEGMRNIRG